VSSKRFAASLAHLGILSSAETQNGRRRAIAIQRERSPRTQNRPASNFQITNRPSKVPAAMYLLEATDPRMKAPPDAYLVRKETGRKIVKRICFSKKVMIVPTVSRKDYTEEEKSACWWSQDEATERQLSVSSLVRRRLSKCMNSSALTPVSLLADMQDDVQRSREIKSSHEKHINSFWMWSVMSDKLRGLEKAISKKAIGCGLWTSFQRADEAADIRCLVLQIQASLPNSEDAIASMYHSQSRAACMYARQLGMADSVHRIIDCTMEL
jgi:hypothetical protein